MQRLIVLKFLGVSASAAPSHRFLPARRQVFVTFRSEANFNSRLSMITNGRVSMYILFLFLWAVWNDEKSKQKGKTLKNNADRLYTCIIWDNSRCNNRWETMLLCFYCAHCERKLQDFVKFQLETISLFFSLNLFLNF